MEAALAAVTASNEGMGGRESRRLAAAPLPLPGAAVIAAGAAVGDPAPENLQWVETVCVCGCVYEGGDVGHIARSSLTSRMCV